MWSLFNKLNKLYEASTNALIEPAPHYNNIISFIKQSSTETILNILHDGGNINVKARPVHEVDATAHLFILPNGQVINMNHYNSDYEKVIALNRDDEIFNQTHDYLPACLVYVLEIMSGASTEEANEEVFDQAIDYEEAVNELVNSLGWIRYNCGEDLMSGYWDSAGYIHLPMRKITSSQIIALKKCLEYNEIHRIPFSVFTSDESSLHLNKEYLLGDSKNPIFTEDVIKDILRHYNKRL